MSEGPTDVAETRLERARRQYSSSKQGLPIVPTAILNHAASSPRQHSVTLRQQFLPILCQHFNPYGAA